MIVFPNAKINLGLNVTEKRSDGYHNIETLFYPIGLCDILEVLDLGNDSIQFTQTGIDLPAKQGDNLVEKAYKLMHAQGLIPSMSFHLHKAIPFGAGLGGGSSDASYALKCINEISDMGLSNDELKTLSSQIGADCPFFIDNQAALASGIGDVLSPVQLSLSGYHFLLIKPNIEVPTPQAYKFVVPKQPMESISRIITSPIETWKGRLVNDFEASVFKSFLEIGRIKEELYSMGAVYASMSGSGSSVYGIFQEHVEVPNQFEDCFVYQQKF